MHPILSRPDRAWLALAFAGATGVLAGVLPLRAAGAAAEEAAWFSAWGGVLMFLSLQSWHIARYVPIDRVTFPRLLLTVAAASAALGGVWLLIGWSAAALLAAWLPTVPAAFSQGWPGAWAAGTLICAGMLLLIYALEASDQGEASARKALESEISSREAELRALRAQVDPHFLFNCLHSISAMTSRNADGARRMCLELAEFFRASLKAGAEQRITLAKELELVQAYLGIEQVRFGDRLRIRVDDPGESAGVMVPPLLLQPLVENAVRHGVATLVEGGDVAVKVTPGPERVEIDVENAFDPDGRRAGSGVGLSNVRDRLDAAYRGAAKIRVDTVPGPAPLFKVSLSIPVENRT